MTHTHTKPTIPEKSKRGNSGKEELAGPELMTMVIILLITNTNNNNGITILTHEKLEESYMIQTTVIECIKCIK